MENFLKVLTEDATVREDFLRQTTPEGAYLVAKPYLDGMPMEEFVESLLGIAHVMDQATSSSMTAAELTNVSGGAQEVESTVSFKTAMKYLNQNFSEN